MMLPGAPSMSAAASDPLALIDRLPSADDAGVRLVCQKVLLRELGREPVYRRLLECVLGFAQQPAQTTDGGWLQRPRRGGAGKDARVPLLSSDPRFAWNALHILRSLRDTREIQLDETMLPFRTQVIIVTRHGPWASIHPSTPQASRDPTTHSGTGLAQRGPAL